MPLKKHIVITSIFPPTKAVKQFARIPGCQVVVVGDKKSPQQWSCPNTTFLPVDGTETTRFSLHSVLPYNHYCRKMLGYLHAIRSGAECIVDTDDDNIPKPGWGFPEFDGPFPCLEPDKGFINIYRYYANQHIWPRGLPLRCIHGRESMPAVAVRDMKVGVWQGLADGDPDVDAIYRLTSDAPCEFESKGPVVLGKGTVTPFNTQNTCIRKELFPLLYLPTYVTFRFTDILRGLIAQPILWLYGWNLGFTDATVVQERNPHDYFKDFLLEMPMYQHAEEVVDIVSEVLSANESIEGNLLMAYRALRKKNIVGDPELVTLDAWLKDLE
jgi:hypothetical protein